MLSYDQRMKKWLGGAAIVLVLGGCSTSPQTTPEPTETNDPKAAYCEAFGQQMSAYQTFITAITTGDVDLPTFEERQAAINTLEAVAPEEAKADLEDYASPLDQIQTVVDAGGGDITINTDSYKLGAIAISDYCG